MGMPVPILLFLLSLFGNPQMSYSVTSAHPHLEMSQMLKYFFNAHACNLSSAASKYEQLYAATSFAQFHKMLYKTHPEQLLAEVQQDMQEICVQKEVQTALGNACNKVATGSDINERLLYWEALKVNISTIQGRLRKSRLSHVWFPRYVHEDELEFMKRNQVLVLSDADKRYLKIDNLLIFFPFALIEHCDKEAFEWFVKARNEG